MKRFLALIGIVALVGGCSGSDDTELRLVGSWGGPNMLVSGTHNGATLLLPCSTASFNTALRLDEPSGFVATGVLRFNGSNSGEAPTRVIVRATQDTALLQLQTMYQGEWGGNEVYRVVHGQPITYPGGRICAL